MHKTMLFTAALLAGGLMFTGCVFMDQPNPQGAGMQGEISCMGGCGSNTDGHGWLDPAVMGTAGPPGTVTDYTEGEYWGAVQNTEAEEVVACHWAAGGGGATRIDTYHMGTSDEASGCPPFTYLCSWGIFPLGTYADLCSPGPPYSGVHDTLCNVGNGQCVGPIPSFSSLPGSTWFNYPPNSMDAEFAFLCIDETPGTSPFEGSGNIRRMVGRHCEDCGATATGLQAPEGKTVVCHVPPGNPANEHTIIVGDPAVPAHLAHGDYLGECGGVVDGEGLQIPDGNFIDWMLGVGYSVSTASHVLLGAQPWTDDYFSCLGGNCGGSSHAVGVLQEAFAANPTNETGLTTIGISKLHGSGEVVELSPPLELHIKMNIVNGQPTFEQALDFRQEAVPEVVRWLLANTRDKAPLDLTGTAFELTSGHIITGNTVLSALPYQLTLNHDRLAQAIPNWEQFMQDGRDLDARVAGR